MRTDPGNDSIPAYCDAALPVPLDRTFTYALPDDLRPRVRVGCRVQVPLGSRTLAGIVLGTHGAKPDFSVRPVGKLLDPEPVLSAELIELGRWISAYYCAPIGEALKAMLPLGGETRAKKVVSLTSAGAAAADEARAALSAAMPETAVLLSLRRRPLTLPYLERKHAGARQTVQRLKRRGLVLIEESIEGAGSGLSPHGLQAVEAGAAGAAPTRLTSGERWLLDYLQRHPGAHDLRALSVQRGDVARIARKLAKTGAVQLSALRSRQSPRPPEPRLALNESQRAALSAVEAAIREARFETFLLEGVTGSGKTEVYLRAIEIVRHLGRSALLLVPEIGLTPVLAAQFFDRFGDQVAILHSAFSAAQRSAQWRRIQSGQARVVLGTRSGVFAPLTDLGLVIVDEEHDSSYKQDEAPRYHGRDVAIVRARLASAPVILGSATPALESRWNAGTGKYRHLSLPKRILERPLPEVGTIDMRVEFAETGRASLFSRQLAASVRETLARGEQALVLLNRRGYAAYVSCRSCGARIECGDCSVTLTYHRREKQLLCHYCDRAEPVPGNCPACGRRYLHFHGSGSEKAEAELAANFPEARIARLDRDTVKARGSYETILAAFRAGERNLLVGTQMIAKGHDIPNVTLVGVVDADTGLGRPDFRAAERTFQLLTQVAGRSGRGEKPGRVLLQTMNPDHYAIELAARQDYAAFYLREMRFRKSLRYPPVTAMASMVVRSRKLPDALAMSGELGGSLRPVPAGLRMIGPVAAPLAKLRTEYRYQFLLKANRRAAIAALLGRARSHASQQGWPATALVIDVDPVNLS